MSKHGSPGRFKLEWTPEQAAALDKAGRWLKAHDKPVFRLFGYAGTGKTTLARHLAEGIDNVAFAAFTGKAALVMRKHGCEGARTIHSLIYRPIEDEHGNVRFVLDRNGAAADASLIVVDECSMVDEEMGQDLLSFKKPILVLGDPFQLPPPTGDGRGFFTECIQDVMLTEVHRQSAGSPIIRLATAIRKGERLEPDSYGDMVSFVRRSEIDLPRMIGAGQVLCGRNATRYSLTRQIRAEHGHTGLLPAAGERLVCLRNNRTKGLINGGLWTVESLHGVVADFVRLTLRSEDEEREPVKVEVLTDFFKGKQDDIPYLLRRKSDEFYFGYALTVHKAQGSQWEDVLVFDESFVFRTERARWLYTGVTRAAKRLTVVKD